MPSRQNVTRRRQRSSESRMWWTWHPPPEHWQNMFNFIAVKSSPLHPLFASHELFILSSVSRARYAPTFRREKRRQCEKKRNFLWRRGKVKSSIRKFFSSSIIQNDDGTDNLACAFFFFFFLDCENFLHPFSPDFLLLLRLDKIKRKVKMISVDIGKAENFRIFALSHLLTLA